MRASNIQDGVSGRKAELRIIKRVIPYFWPKGKSWIKTRVVLAMAALVLSKLVSVIAPYFYGLAVDDLSGEAPSGPMLLAFGAIGLTMAYGTLRLLDIGFQQLRDAIFAKVAQRALREIALVTFRHIHGLSLRYHITRKTGGLSRIMERGVKGVAFLLRFLVFSIVPLMLQLLLVSVALVFLFDWRYLLVILAAIVAYVAFTAVITEWRVRIRKAMNAQDTEANQKAIDSLLNFETVKYFGAEGREAARYDVSMQKYEKFALQTTYSLGIINFGQGLIINLAMVVVMIMSAMEVAAGTATVGDFVMVNSYLMLIITPLNFLGVVYREIRQSLVDMTDLFDLLDQGAEVTDREGARVLQVKGGHVALHDVRFSYDPEREILKGVSLDIPPGQTVAIVGQSGSGKSTIGRLLFRFYDVTGGGIEIDGQDLRDVTQDSLHAAIGVVPQDTVLFNDTVYYNIAYGRADATRADVEAAAKAAQIHDFIVSLPDGYDTVVGERGLKLSGGEKQRVGIARTLLKNPPILLLDEATSALDTETEHGILESLIAMGEGRTVITIAHRLSTIVHADRIVVLEHGEVIEEGTHDALLDQDGRYAQLWHMQQAEG
ncbi:MAG: ABCB family ABC transporter ATP-binding protein/permease [Planktomarina sp.]